MKKKTVADLLLDEIEANGTEVVFLVPGANLFPFIKCLIERNKLKLIIANHELAAGFMAIGYALASGNPGVVCTIGSPGLAYLAGAGMAAKADNIPLLCISGNIPEHQWGQGLFQDGSPEGSNDVAIFNEVTGLSLVCQQPQQMTDLLFKMHARLLELKPVHIQLPVDIQSSPIDPIVERRVLSSRKVDPAYLSNFQRELSVRTGLLIGHKAKNLIKPEVLGIFVEHQGIAVITDL